MAGPSKVGWLSGSAVSVAGFAVGDRVAALTITTSGGYSDVVTAAAPLVAAIPAGLDPATAAATCTNTVTAVAALQRVSEPTGRSVLVHAGAGGVGYQFAQVARVLGASHVAAVVGSAAKADEATHLGYDAVYLRHHLDEVPTQAWDVIVDPVGGAATQAAADHLAPFGILLRVGNASGAEAVGVDSMRLWLSGTTVAGFNLGAYTAAHPEQVGRHLRHSLTLVADGSVAVPVTRQVSLPEAKHALSDVLAGTTTGKVVIAL